MPIVRDRVEVVTLEQVEEKFKKNPRGFGYCSDEADAFPAKLGFTEPGQISQVFIHIRTLKELGKLRRVRSATREPRQNQKNLAQNVWRYQFEYTEYRGSFARRHSRSSDFFVH